MDGDSSTKRKMSSLAVSDYLSLSLPGYTSTTPPPPPPPQFTPAVAPIPPQETARRRKLTRGMPEGANKTIPPPFPWAANERAHVRSLGYLRSQKITTISGEVRCKKCEQKYPIEFDLEQNFAEISSFIAKNKARMRQRAPKQWMSPSLPNCRLCNQESTVRPLIADKKRSINWLFLLLGRMLGCCTLDQLKYFCKHTRNHRTGAKDRVLFLAYLALCKQLDPNGPFDI